MIKPPAIVRPNGKFYRPRKIAVMPWENDDAADGWKAGVLVFGTHDVALAQSLADAACKQIEREFVATSPRPVWYRDGFENGERTWIHDDVRGRAGISFRADYPESAA